jgi:hypothetical protein
VRVSFARPLRNSDAPATLESFLVAAVTSFLAIRSFLTLTGFPRVGSGEIHIAHMLWGGLLMLASLLIVLAYLGRSVQWVAAIVAGLGFGTFIDEIGKFVTSDNDYFYRPAVALIYVAFVAVFLVARALEGRRQLTEREAMGNALDLLEGTLGSAIESRSRIAIERLLDQAPSFAGLGSGLRAYLATVPSERDGDARRLSTRLGQAYERVAALPWFEPTLAVGVIVYAVLATVSSLALLLGPAQGASDSVGTAAIGEAISTIVGAALIGRGVLALHESRASAYRWFARGLLVWILVTQVFIFYRSQLAGLGGLAIDLVAYVMTRFAIRREAGVAPS